MKNTLTKQKIIIDTDPGHDDALAIMLAVKSNLFEIKAITTMAGNSTIENTTRNARYILQLLNREDIPIYSGASKPLNRELIKAVVHGKSGLDGIDPTNEANITNNAVEKIIEIVKDNPHQITLVTLGPLTNIAQAILQAPETMKNVKEIITMGGAIKVPGNKNRVAEFNIFVDPEAADVMVRFPVKKTFVPLDACNHVQLSLEDFEKIENENLRGPIIKMIKPYINNIEKDIGIKAALMYDPLTVYFLINPNSSIKKDYNLVIETKGEHTSGMTVVELRKVNDCISNVTVVERINEKEFKKDFISFLNS
jgi:pyrimidine-specific ribonucleoside hydrolase